jgi:ATP adenylyltransferase
VLWQKLVERTAAARASGHLESIPTSRFIAERHGVRWVIRMAAELVEQKKRATTTARNPFLPYEPEMFVADLSDTHVALLNKFNVVDHHLVIVTRHFEHQPTLLTAADFEALSLCLGEIDGLAFYNGGKAAGASQPHKHVQLVPRVDPELDGIPIEPIIERLPFLAAHAPIDFGRTDLFTTYRMLLDGLHRDPRIHRASGVEANDTTPEGPGERQPFPYDLLVTRRWMLLVPRTTEAPSGIQINSLGYAGSFLARSEEDRRLIEADPLSLLARAAVPLR